MDEKRKKSLDINSLEANLPFYLWNDIEYVKNNFCLDCSTAELEVDLREALKCKEITKYQNIYLEKNTLKVQAKKTFACGLNKLLLLNEAFSK